MKKKKAYLFSAVFLLLCAIAAYSSFPSEYTVESVSVSIDGAGDISDVYVSYDYYGMNGSGFSVDFRNQLDDTSKAVYDILLESYKSGASSQECTLPLSNEFTGLAVFTRGSSVSLNRTSRNEITEWISDAVRPAVLALIYDHPELSWLVNAGYSYNYDPVLGETTDAGTDVSIASVRFSLDDVFTDTGSAADINSAITAARNTINSSRNSTNTYDTLLAIHDYITDKINYNKEATKKRSKYTKSAQRAYQTAYSAFYRCNGDKSVSTVCAGYAKGFKILCDAYDIPCVVVSGDAGEPHMWNYVQVGGKWYAVDCTWDDQESGVIHEFFLVGSSDTAEGFGNATFAESHTPSGRWDSSGYIFRYPRLSSENCAPSAGSSPAGTGAVTDDPNAGMSRTLYADKDLSAGVGEVTVWANGNPANKTKTLYTGIKKTGRLAAAITSENKMPTVVNGVILKDSEASELATAFVGNNDQIKVSGAHKAGKAFLWVLDIGVDKSIGDSVVIPVTVMGGAKDITFTDNTGAQVGGSEVLPGGSATFNIVGTVNGSDTADDSTYTVAADNYSAKFVDIVRNGDTVTVTAKGLNPATPGRELKARIDVVCDQSGKRSTYMLTVVNPVTEVSAELTSGNVFEKKNDRVTLKINETTFLGNERTTYEAKAYVFAEMPTAGGGAVSYTRSDNVTARLDYGGNLTLTCNKVGAAAVYVSYTHGDTTLMFPVAAVSADGVVTAIR